MLICRKITPVLTSVSKPKRYAKWEENTSEQMNAALANSGIKELNDLSDAVEVTDLINIYNERMVLLYNKCNVLHKSSTNQNPKRDTSKNNKSNIW